MHINFSLSRQSFQSEYLEKNYLLLRGALRHAPFSMADIDQVLHATEPTNPMMRINNNGSFVPEEAFVEVYNDLGTMRRRVIRQNFYGLLKAGATLILNRVDARQPLIRALCLEVSQFVQQHTLANGYLAFGNKASFGKHWDCHDVFAVQLHGRKRWQLFRPTMELPLSTQTSKDVKSECPAEPVLDTVLEAGDVLYVPRGWWHCATPIGEETFHVAIGVHPPYVNEYISWLCSTKLPDFLSCRQSMAFGKDNLAQVRAAGQDVLAALANEEYLAEYLALINHSDRVPSPFNLREGVSGAVAPMQPDTEVRINAVYPRAGDNRPLVVNGSVVELAGTEQALMQQLRAGQPVTIAQLEAGMQADGATVRAALTTLLARDAVQLLTPA